MLTASQVRDNYPLPDIRFLQSPPHLRPRPADTMADVLGRHLLLLTR